MPGNRRRRAVEPAGTWEAEGGRAEPGIRGAVGAPDGGGLVADAPEVELWARWQLTRCPGATSVRAGVSVRQTSTA